MTDANEMTKPPRAAARALPHRWLLAAVLAAAPLSSAIVVAPSRAADKPAAPSPPAAATDDDPVPPKVEAAVDRALTWLAKNQKPDGSWEQGTISTTAVPSLAVMAFLARGHVPGQGPYGDTINRAIDYVLQTQRPDGLLSAAHGNASMYEHGISTAMLSESFGMIDDARKQKIEKAIARSAQLILDAQKVPKDAGNTGGWRYAFSARDSDISVTGWQLMALRGAANCGATVPKEALDAGREYIRRCAVDAGGFAYQTSDRRGANAPRTGTGIVALEMLGDHGSKEALKGGDYLLEHIPESPTGGEFYFYAVYYVSQALNQLGGKYWDVGYPKLRDALLATQDDRGVWPHGNGQEEQAGEAYRTSMAVLALCVPYRYLPLYQK